MELVSSAIIEPVVNVLTNHITQKLRNLTSSADRVKDMKDKMKVLDGHRIDNENHLRRNLADYKEIPARVQEWLEEVKKIKEDVKNDGCFVLEKKMRRNSENNQEMPDRVPESLEEVEKIKEDADNIPTNNDGCFNIKKKYRAGRNALRYIKVINRLIEESSEMNWSDAPIGFGRVDSKRLASTSGGGTQNLFKSRDKTFNEALKLLQQDDDKNRVIALCGMGGVGKTTLMNDLKEVAKNEKMFNCIVKAVIGNTPNLLDIQKVIAADTGAPLTESNETLMATYLTKRFEEFSEHNKRCLVILDDVWEKIKLEDIGLASPLPKGVKLLLTSRNADICHQIALDAGFVLQAVRVDVLEEEEARDFFCQITKISAEHDHDLYKKGCKIVKKCGYLPLAIKLIATTLNSKDEYLWRHTLKRLKKNDLEKNVQKIINISYESLVPDDKEIFLLCGLFPEDSNIPVEDLTRYAWGLEHLKEVSSMKDARDSTQISVRNLKNAYLLMNGDSRHSDCVKMHDLVLAFVVGTVSKGGKDGCRIMQHDDFSKLSEANNMSQSCKQLSLTCKGMSEYPSEFRFPNLSLLKLTHGDELLRAPQDFYETMDKLQVIAFEKLEYPLVPTSVQFSANLRTLCLHECSLMFDLACIGNLLNLEVLSFANSGITILPSTFGNLVKLRLLDVTGCYNLVIDDGVLKNLVKLEELYMRSFKGRALCFTDNNSSELAERSKNLRALEFEFIGDNAHMKNMSCEKLRRFKLSVGCYFREVRDELETNQVDVHSYENSLKLVTNREDLLKSKINKLFEFTNALYLQVNDMNSIEDVEIPDPPRNSSFYKLRILVVSACAKLKYLFTPSVAKQLSKLEYLEISGCPIMEAVIHTENEAIHTENDGSDIIKFSNLKYLRLDNLPKFSSIYPDSATSFLNKQDVAPKLEKLVVSNMENLKEIWPPLFSISNLCSLRELTVEGCGSIEVLFNMDLGEIEQRLSSSLRSITVKRCDSLVKLFSCNPFPFLKNLQELNIVSCGSIQVLFNTDLGPAGKSEEQVCSNNLRSIKVWRCDSLVNLLPSNPMPLFNHLERLVVISCASVEVIFDMDMGCVGEMDKVSSSRLRRIELWHLGKLREVWRIKDAGNNNLIHGFEAVESISVIDCERFENIITPATTNFDMRALKQVTINSCGRESERNTDLVESNQEIDVVSISKVALPFSLLHTSHHLHKLELNTYKGVEVVFEITTPVSRESPHNTQQQLIILPNLEQLELVGLDKMSHVWKCNWNELILQKQPSPSSFRNLTTINMTHCSSIKYLFSPLMAKLLSSLKQIDIWYCKAIEEVVSNRYDEDASINSHTTTTFFPNLHKLLFWGLKNFKCIGGGVNGISSGIHDQLKLPQASWSLCQYAREISIRYCDALSSVIPWYAVGQMQIDKKVMLKLPKLKMLKIEGCNLLEHIFTFSVLESLTQLEELEVKDCKAMEVIVMEENDEQTTASVGVVFPHLKSITLVNLPNFVGFFLGKNEFIWPALEKVVIGECPQITVFTCGQSTAPKLKFINTSLGKHSVECGLNFHVTTTSHQDRLPSYESTSSYRRLPWSYHNLIEADMDNNPRGGQTLFLSDEVSQLQKLETVHCSDCRDVEQIFDSETDAEIPNLRQVDLRWLESLKYIWKSKQGTVLKFPYLTRLFIWRCDSLEYVFTCPMVGSLLQLQELHINMCRRVKVIVKGEEEEEEEEESDAIVNATVVFPCLKLLRLFDLKSLEGFWLGKEAFEFPSLDTLLIDWCEKMRVFSNGDLSAPKLQAISIEGRKYNIQNRLLNSFF